MGMEKTSYDSDLMDDFIHQLSVAFGFSSDHGELGLYLFQVY